MRTDTRIELEFQLAGSGLPEAVTPGLALELMAASAQAAGQNWSELCDFWAYAYVPAETLRLQVDVDGEIRVYGSCLGGTDQVLAFAHLGRPPADGGAEPVEADTQFAGMTPAVLWRGHDPAEDASYYLHPQYLDAALAVLGLSAAIDRRACLLVSSVRFLALNASPTHVVATAASGEGSGERTLALLEEARAVVLLEGARLGSLPVHQAVELSTLSSLVADVLELDEVPPNVNLKELGASSVHFARISNALQDRFGCAPSLPTLLSGTSVAVLLRYYVEQVGGEHARLPDLLAASERSRWPLTPPQQQQWLRLQAKPTDNSYNIAFRWRFSSAVDPQALESALMRLLERHEVLRAPVVVAADGTPFQEVTAIAACPSPLLVCDDERELLVRREQGVVDPTAAPLLRATLLCSSQGGCLFSLVFSHLVVDDAALLQLFADLERLYSAETGADVELGDPDVPYCDAAWWFASEAVRGHLADLARGSTEAALLAPPTRVSLSPNDMPDLDAPAARLRMEFSAAERAELSAAAARHGVSLHTLMLAAYAILLRWHMEHDPLIQLVALGRSARWMEACVGLFANPLLCACQIRSEATVAQQLASIADAAAHALERQMAPVLNVIADYQQARNSSDLPTQVGMSYRSEQGAPLRLGSWQSEFEAPRLDFAPEGSARLDLELFIDAGGESLVGEWVYRTTALTDAAATRLSGWYRWLLQAMAAEPDTTVGALRATCEANFDELRAELRGPSWDLAGELAIEQRIRAHAQASPDKVAVWDAQGPLSYRDFWLEVERVASRLRARVPPGGRVALALPRDRRLVVAVVAVMEAGCQFVPLDLAHPPARLAATLKASESVAVLVSGATAFPDELAVPRVLYSGPPGENGSRAVSGGGYVVFTSGSTGEPKGVPIGRRQLANLLVSMVDLLKDTGASTWLALTTATFDISVFDWFYPLTTGGTVVVGQALDADGLDFGPALELARVAGVDGFQATPSVVMLALEDPSGVALLAQLKVLFVSGEALPLELARRLQERCGATLLSLYGPTETTIWSSGWALPPTLDGIRIGRPFPNTSMRVTNERGEVVPRGVPGELRIAGEGLSPGYLGNPELTDRAFILDPTTGTRWYRTGDLVRQDDDGQLQWLARVDRQVKISGRRLEPAEVERVIENHPGVDRCAVVLSDCLGRPSVHAFLVPVDSAGSGATELETWLAQQRSTRPPREEEGTKSASETWKDGLSGELVSDAAAREWQEASWRRLRLDASEKVLGLGCGAQAANRLASSCGAYHGITWDPASKPQATEGPASGSAARIDPGYVHGERTFAEAPFDVIVFDDCVEDFPASDYLARELGRARAALSSRGRMLISGVRDLRLQWARALWSAVVLTSRRKTVAELRERAAAVERDEYGLVVDPKGFRDWAGPCVARLRRGRHWHERNRYRYDVVVGRDVFAAGSDLPEQTWPTETSLESVARAVCESGTGVVLRGIPNGRLDAEATLVRLVSELPADTSIDSLVTRVNAERRRGEDPETICQLLEGCGCLVEPLVGTADPFLFDVLILSQEHRGEPAQLPSGPPDALACNVPGPGRRDLLLTVGVRTMCRQRLPSYLVPQRIELVPSFPLTANGKLDLAGLSGPVSRASHTASQGRAPSVGLEELLAGLVCEALGLDVIAADEDVFELGATSLTAVRLGSMAREHALSITSSQLFRTRTIERLARDIEQQRASLPEPMANARFSSLAEPGGARWPDNPRVLLTGATGYVGAFLLAALLDGERCQSVLCLVRGNGPSEALARVRKSAGRVGLLAKIPWSRVDVVCGDLGEPQLGLTEPELDAIGDRCDAIVHNAARVNFLDPYAVLHATNVRGTETLVRLAMAGRSRPFHYISSVAAVGPGSTSPPDESWDASIPSDGYGRSKRGGETIVRAAADAGLPVAIYRLGVVASDERFTVAATDDWLFRWLSGVLQLGACYSGGPEEAIRHVVPVDWVAEAVVRLASGSDALQVYHLAPPNSVPAATLVRWLREAVARMVAVPHDEWLERLRSDLPFNPLIPLMDVLRDERAMPTRLQEVDSRATGLELSALGMQWPHLDATTVAGWVRLVGG